MRNYRKYFNGILFIVILILILYFKEVDQNEYNSIPFSIALKGARIREESLRVTKDMDLTMLSELVQKDLARIQNPTHCDVPTLHCGYQGMCGLGCQIHHRVACLIISYSYNIPLIHDQLHGWPYSKNWNDVFYPLGSSCTPGPHTFYLTFLPKSVLSKLWYGNSRNVKFPLDDGILVPKSLGDQVELLHPVQSYNWWIGQFMKFGLRLNPTEAKIVDEAQRSLNFSHPVVGIHVRRTDKLEEYGDSFHKIEDYFAIAEEYYQNLTLKGIPFDSKRVFVASDDQDVLAEAQRKFPSPEWNVFGFNHGRTLTTPSQRSDSMDQIVKDLFTLAECDYVVCGHSSNVCRLLFEMMNFHHQDGSQRLSSLDGSYLYLIQGHSIPGNVIKI